MKYTIVEIKKRQDNVSDMQLLQYLFHLLDIELGWPFGLEFWVIQVYLVTLNLNTVCKEKQSFALVESCEKKTLEKIPEGISILFMAISENLGLKTVIMAIMFLLADDQLCAIMKKLWNKQMLVGTSGKNIF